ncbi:MAG: glycoside hydrolase family 3 N-terminal domain-containing protein [Treponema sp.]
MNKFIKVTVFAVTVFSLQSCSSNLKNLDEKEIRIHEEAFKTYSLLKQDAAKKENAIREYISSLSTEEKISQLFLINLESNKEFIPVEWYKKKVFYPDGNVKTEKKTLIPSGYIFFGYNIADNPEQIINFTSSVLEYAYKENTIPPFLSVDVEGGFVNRLRNVAGPLPENERVSEVLLPSQAYSLYSLYAGQLAVLGFNLNLAPVIEICSDKNREFLSGRSYGTENQVIEYSSKNINACKNNSVGTVVKHFPGNTNIDPHIGLPKLNMTEAEFEQTVRCFSAVLKENPEGILMSHVIVPEYDSHPSCLSKFWVTDIVRNKMNYDGIIFSDDIFMAALIDNGYSPKVASRMAVDAGIDCIMVSEKKFGRWLEILYEICLNDENFATKIEESVFRILKFKMKNNLILCEYDKESGSYSVRLPVLEKDSLSECEKKMHVNAFYDNKKMITEIYNSHFLSSASDEEKKAFGVDVK